MGPETVPEPGRPSVLDQRYDEYGLRVFSLQARILPG